MRQILIGSGIVALAFACAFGQSTQKLTFEVASVKPAAPPPQPGPGGRSGMIIGRRGGPGTPDPGQINWTNATLKSLLTTAYDVRSYQVTGPAWLDSERYDIAAKVPEGSTQEQVNVMW